MDSVNDDDDSRVRRPDFTRLENKALVDAVIRWRVADKDINEVGSKSIAKHDWEAIARDAGVRNCVKYYKYEINLLFDSMNRIFK